MRLFTLIVLCASLAPSISSAAELNLATLTCGKYENEVLPAAASSTEADSIDTVMWLFGYSVAKSGKHVLYPDALAPFGFALDNECKSNPTETMLDALAIVKPESKNPLDLANAECSSFAAHHNQFAHSDAESAATIMMWLFGFTIGQSGGHVFDAAARPAFESALLAQCAKQPTGTLLEALKALKFPKPREPRAPAPRRVEDPSSSKRP